MANNEILKRDQNHITVLGGVTNDSDQDIRMLRVDPITKRLLVSATGTSGGSGFQRPIAGNADGSNMIFTFATAPNAIVIDETRTIQKIQADGATTNWSGTTTITLTTWTPQFDIFAVA